MAVAYKSVSAIVQATASNLTITVPSVSNGDCMIAVLTGSANGQVPAIAGWSQVHSADSSNFAGHRTILWRMALSEPANYTTTGLSAGTQWGLIFIVSGTDTWAPLHKLSGTDKSNAGTALTCTAIVPGLDNCLICEIVTQPNVQAVSAWTDIGATLTWAEQVDTSSANASIAIGTASQTTAASVQPSATQAAAAFAHMIAIAFSPPQTPSAGVTASLAWYGA